MTEAEWLACKWPESMIKFLGTGASGRKLRLFAIASVRLVERRIQDLECRAALLVFERYADGLVERAELEVHTRRVEELRQRDLPVAYPHMNGRQAVAAVLPWFDAETEPATVSPPVVVSLRKSIKLIAAQEILLLRDIFGNPFRPVAFSPSWRTDTAVSLARGMYESRDFGAMPILADALQDAGCDNDDILNHCRTPGEHVRGCWVVDLVLGNE